MGGRSRGRPPADSKEKVLWALEIRRSQVDAPRGTLPVIYSGHERGRPGWGDTKRRRTTRGVINYAPDGANDVAFSRCPSTRAP